MAYRNVVTRRTIAVGMTATLASALAVASVAAGASEPDLMATLELRDGNIEYELEIGTLHFFDQENQPLAIQVIDGCALNDHYWIFGAGLSGVPIPLNVLDLDTGKSADISLPPFEPGKPIGTVFDPEALPLCGEDVQVGGLPPLRATADFRSADGRGTDVVDTLTLLSDGSERSYQRISRNGESFPIISKGSPIVAVDESPDMDQLFLFTEGRTPRDVEGIVFSGGEGMLPDDARLEKVLKGLTNARVRRAFETAANGRVPQGIIEDLRLKRVEHVHHVDLDFDSLGADAYLATARWIREGGKPIKLPEPVEPRFTVELVRADGTRVEVPLTGPFVGADNEGLRWEYGSGEALAQIYDACALSGSFWTWTGALTNEPLELVITDTQTGVVTEQLLWTDRRELSGLADAAVLESCP